MRPSSLPIIGELPITHSKRLPTKTTQMAMKIRIQIPVDNIEVQFLELHLKATDPKVVQLLMEIRDLVDACVSAEAVSNPQTIQ